LELAKAIPISLRAEKPRGGAPVQIDFVHFFGQGTILPIPHGKSVLVVSASIPLGRTQPGYSDARIERLKADAKQFVTDNYLADFVMTQGAVQHA
jgi:hypothetical protein